MSGAEPAVEPARLRVGCPVWAHAAWKGGFFTAGARRVRGYIHVKRRNRLRGACSAQRFRKLRVSLAEWFWFWQECAAR